MYREIIANFFSLIEGYIFAYLNTGKSIVIYDKINEIADIDAHGVKQSQIEFEEVSDEWRKAHKTQQIKNETLFKWAGNKYQII